MPAKGSKQAASFSAFISYAKADGTRAQEIAASLEERGFNCWIAPRDVRPGRSYGDEIIRGIERSRCLLLVLSSASNGSAFVAREIERAISKKKPVFPIRIENVEPSPSLELFISGTQWIDAFSGRLGPHIDRLADLLAEEDRGAPVAPAASEGRAEARKLPNWTLPIGAAVAVLLVLGAGLALWQGGEQTSDNPERTDTALATQSASLPRQELAHNGGGTPDPVNLAAAARRDPDFQTCETALGGESLAACDRAIASGKFTGRNLSYLYSDRGFVRMQTGELNRALADLNEAARIDSTNFYAFWNRGAVHTAKGDLDRAQEDFTTALALNPDKTSKAKIEEALNAVTASAQAVRPQVSDPSVISDPSVFWGPQTGVAGSAASTYSADTMPASPAMPAMPAAPPPGPGADPMAGPPSGS